MLLLARINETIQIGNNVYDLEAQKYETYTKIINIEARAMIDIASKHIIPAVITYITSLANSINEVRKACDFVDVSVQIELLEEASKLLAETMSKAAERVLEMPIKCDVEITKAWYGEKVVIE